MKKNNEDSKTPAEIIETNEIAETVLELPKNMAFIKQVLIKKAAGRLRRKAFNIKFAPVFGALLAVAAVGFYMKVDYNNTNSQRNELGGIWCTYDDRAQGGTSEVWPPASTSCENLFVKSEPGFGNRGYAVRITGTAGTKLGYDFIGVNTFLSEYSTCPRCNGINLRKFRGIEFKIKGTVEAGSVMFILPYEGTETDKMLNTCKSLTDYADYETDITDSITPEWKTVRIDFKKDLKQPDWAKKENLAAIDEVLADANLIKWQYKGGKGRKVDIWIDDLQLY